MIRSAVLLLLVASLAVSAPVPKVKPPEIDLRDPDGKVLLAADDLVSYDWKTHTLTLKDGAKKPFGKALEAAGKFAVCIDGKPAMEGRFVPPTISSTRKGPVISLPDDFEEDEGKEEQSRHRRRVWRAARCRTRPARREGVEGGSGEGGQAEGREVTPSASNESPHRRSHRCPPITCPAPVPCCSR